MYFNLALKNIKRSARDYTIYFMTLMFGVCIFYTFNSIQSQTIMLDLSDSQKAAFSSINVIMSITSVFVSFILGFLILYVNNYLIKRRKKEFGIYMTLGMEKSKISRILFIESLVLGFLSLGIGLLLGILLSQGLSIFTAKLFDTKLNKFIFIFSSSSALKTVMCFLIIYIIVFIFNNFSLKKIKLINLINAKKKNEKLLISNILISVIIFFISVVMIGTAYYLILKKGTATIGGTTDFLSVGLGAIGTLLLFLSLTGFFLKVVQTSKKTYLRGLNMFVLRQLNSKINTTFISMAFVCLMLFIAICTLSTGLGLNKSINSSIKNACKFDITISGNNVDLDKYLKDHGLDISSYTKDYSNVELYKTDIHYKSFFNKDNMGDLNKYYPIYINDTINVIKLSQLNKTLQMLGEKPITLKENQYMVISNIGDGTKYIDSVLKSKKQIDINNNILIPANDKASNIIFYNGFIKSDILIFVVNDSVVNNLPKVKSYINIDTNKGLSEITNKMKLISKENGYIDYANKDTVEETPLAFGVMIAYLSIYLGLIFLIASSVVLAIQQLSESTDNIERYNLMDKIGVDRAMINKSIFIQIAIYFIIPLAVALIHSIVGLKLAQDIVSSFGYDNVVRNIMVTAVILVSVYGGYFIATYIIVKNNINRKLNK